MSLSERTRLDVWQRDDGTCQICGGPGSEIDHIIPKMMGGRHGQAKKDIERMENYRLLCVRCHRGKHG